MTNQNSSGSYSRDFQHSNGTPIICPPGYNTVYDSSLRNTFSSSPVHYTRSHPAEHEFINDADIYIDAQTGQFTNTLTLDYEADTVDELKAAAQELAAVTTWLTGQTEEENTRRQALAERTAARERTTGAFEHLRTAQKDPHTMNTTAPTACEPFTALAHEAAGEGITLVHPEHINHYYTAERVEDALAAGYDRVVMLCGVQIEVTALSESTPGGSSGLFCCECYQRATESSHTGRQPVISSHTAAQ